MPVLDALWASVSSRPLSAVCTTSVPADRGATCELMVVSDGDRTFVAKIPSASLDPARAGREAWVLQHLLPYLGVHAPVVHASVDTAYGPALLLSCCGRTDGDVGAIADVDTVEQVLKALTPVHRCEATQAMQEILPRWGVGTTRGSTPHGRRVNRYARRWPTAIGHWAAAEDVSWLTALAQDMTAHLPADLALLAASTGRLMHGDVHADNLRFDGDHVWLLDWQTASIGPPIIDVALWLTAHVGPESADDALALARAHLERVGLPWCDRLWTAAVRSTFCGLCSGYATRLPDAIGAREVAATKRAFASDGVAGWVSHIGC